MKKLFALMALAGLAAFQVGCGGEGDKKPAAVTPPAMGAGGPGAGAGAMPGAPAATGEKKDGEEAKKDDAAATEDKEAPGGDEKKDGEEPKKDE